MHPQPVIMGADEADRRFCGAHAAKLATWYDASGQLTGKEPVPPAKTRVFSGQCLSLLATGDPEHCALANQILRQLEPDKNNFTPIRCAELLLRFEGQLDDDVREHVTGICRNYVVNAMERRLADDGISNWSCMNSFFLAAMSKRLDRYPFDVPHSKFPELYDHHRLAHVGRTAFQALAYRALADEATDEFNSPTYTPLSLMAVAKARQYIDDPAVQEAAQRVEARIWREVLAMYHPGLNLSCGPYSRSYRADMLGHVTNLRLTLAYAGISSDPPMEDLLADEDPRLYHQQNRSRMHRWHVGGYIGGVRYHVPRDALEAMRRRTFPYRVEMPVTSESFGAVDKHGRFQTVQGDLIPGGTSQIVQEQHDRWAIGYRTQTRWGNSYPIYLHYALRDEVRAIGDTRTMTGGVWVHQQPGEWTDDLWGKPIESNALRHMGDVKVEQADATTWRFDATALPQLASLATGEVSLNFFIPTHFDPQPVARLDGNRFDQAPLEKRGDHATARFDDAGFAYEIECHCTQTATIRLHRFANFIRLAVVFHEGEEKHLLADQLASFGVRGALRMLTTR